MGRLVSTLFGLVNEDDMEVNHIIGDDANSHSVATEWRLKRDLHYQGSLVEVHLPDGQIKYSVKGEIARRDASTSILSPEPQAVEQGNLQ